MMSEWKGKSLCSQDRGAAVDAQLEMTAFERQATWPYRCVVGGFCVKSNLNASDILRGMIHALTACFYSRVLAMLLSIGYTTTHCIGCQGSPILPNLGKRKFAKICAKKNASA